MTALPTNVTYGQVTGRFILATADSSDPDTVPDAIPASGSLRFTPAPAYILDPTADPDPAWIMPQPVDGTLDAQGYLVDSFGNRGVWLVATDDSSLIPVNWTYRVTFALNVNIAAINIAVPGGVTSDLSLIAPLPATPGTTVVVTAETAQRAEAALAAMPKILFNPTESTSGQPDGTLVARW